MGPKAGMFLIETNNEPLQRPYPGNAVVSAFDGVAKTGRNEKAVVARHAIRTSIRYRPFSCVPRENLPSMPRKLSLSLVAMDGNVSLRVTDPDQGL